MLKTVRILGILLTLGISQFGWAQDAPVDGADIYSWLENHQIQYSTDPIIAPGRYHSFQKNIEIDSLGSSLKNPPIHLFIPRPGGEDGFLRDVQRLILALRDAEIGHPLSITLLGDQEPGQKSLIHGLRNLDPLNPGIVVYLQGFGSAGTVNIINGSRGLLTPGWMIQGLLQAFNQQGQSFHISNVQTQLYRSGLSATTIIDPILSAGIPAVAIGSSRDTSDPQSVQITTDSLLYFLTNLPHEASQAYQENWERHYLLFQFGSFTFYMGEVRYLAFSILVMSIVILWIQYSQNRRKRYRNLMAKSWWNLPILFAISFVVLLLGGLFSSALLSIQGDPSAWQALPLVYFLVKITAALSLASWFYRGVQNTRLSHRGSFYSAAAVVTQLLVVIFFAIINMSFVYYFLWSLLCTMLFVTSKIKWFKLLWFLLSPFWLVKSIIELFSLGPVPVLELLVGSNILADLLISFILIPYLSMLIRLDFLFPHPKKDRRRLPIRISALLLTGATIAITAVILVHNPYQDTPLPVSITIIRSGDDPANVTISQPVPLTGGVLSLGSRAFPLGSAETRAIRVNLPLPRITWNTQVNDFLGRRGYTGSILLPANTQQITINVSVQTRPVVYDSNFPYLIHPESNTIELLVGDNPPNELPISLILAQNAQPQISISIKTAEPLIPLEIEGPDAQLILSQVLTENGPL